MLDPGLEHLHRHGREWRSTIALSRLKGEAVLDGLLLIPVVLMFVLAPGGEWADPWTVTLLVGAFAVSGVVRFEIGSGSTSPFQLVMVPLWFAVPPAWLTPVIGLGLVLSGVLERVHERDGHAIWRSIFNAGDAWPALGPAVVFALAGNPEATPEAFGVVVAAFAAQTAVDFAVNLGTQWLFHGIKPKTQLPLLVWITMVAAALAPVGFLAAIVAEQEPLAAVALLPLIAVIAEFARERRDRLDQALQLSTTYRGTAQLMGDVLEADDSYTGGEHTQGVVDMAVAVGLELRLDPRHMRDLEFGALLHDIGKLRVPNEIINKPGSLNAAEWEIIRQHPIYGQQMLDRVGGALTDAGAIVRAHHERWDGAGYPDGLAGESIPLAARIITVCDSFSAMTTNRSYSAARSRDEALIEMQRCSGSQFDPSVVEALYRVLERNPALLGGEGRAASDRASSAAAAALGLRPIS